MTNDALTSRYRLGDEIARGGMGVIYRAIDTVLNREIAIKVLQDQYTPDSPPSRRFLMEAQITGRLQHPGIPPVHDLGTLPDGRPFLAMKLIHGQSLAEMLAISRRERNEHNGHQDESARNGAAPNIIAVFEAICQAVGYAHAMGIIHRDLKPHNIMVGAFGEVQVMDWGLAKDTRVVATWAAALDDDEFATQDMPQPRLTNHRTPFALDETRPGDVMGTIPYMPPEQAKGQLEQLGAWSDVFALGGILCQILTGKPVYSGQPVRTLLALAEACDTSDAVARLQASGSDPALIAICKQCLDKDPFQRPASAVVLAELIANYRTNVEARLRIAELERTAALAKAAAERKKRRTQRALAFACGIILLGGIAFLWWHDHQAAIRTLEHEQHARAQQVVETREAVLRQSQAQRTRDGVTGAIALADQLRAQYRYRDAVAVLQHVEPVAASELTPELKLQVEHIRASYQFAAVLDDIRMARSVWKIEHGGTVFRDTQSASPAYRAAFRDHGFDLDTGDTDELANRITQSPVRYEIVAALDDWALFVPDSEHELRMRLLRVARLADPDPWTDRFRDPTVRASRPLLVWLARQANPAKLSVATLAALAELLRLHQLDATPLLKSAIHAYPGDYLILFALAMAASEDRDPIAIGYYRAALALRPDAIAARLNLCSALFRHGNTSDALAELREAVRRHPHVGLVHAHLGVTLSIMGDPQAAIRSLREAIRFDPKYAPAYNNLGVALANLQQYDEAIRAFRDAIRLDPNSALAYSNLGLSLALKGDLDAAILAYRESLRLDPNSAKTITHLGGALAQKGELEPAIDCFRKAIALNPTDPYPHKLLGKALDDCGDLPGCMAMYRTALRLDPNDAEVHNDLGIVLATRGELDEAVFCFEEAVRLKPGNPNYARNLGIARKQKAERDARLPLAPRPRVVNR